MIERVMKGKLLELSHKFQVITLTGPRQSGKTTLVKDAFPTLPYVSLEEPDVRQIAINDPRGFLSNYHNGAVLDEVQHTPELFSYIQSLVDNDRSAQFILTGSANFLLMEKIGQTLAGRTAILHLLPFSLDELRNSGYHFERYETAIYKGQYPRIYDRGIDPADFFPAYIQTYVERDVRMLKNIGDMNAFIQFVQLCAGRTGQLLNYTGLANDAGVSPNTAKSWLSILEASYITYRLQPYHKNYNKRLVKSPKLYFYDTGLACSLLGLSAENQVNLHYMKGALFENLILSEFIKHSFHRGQRKFPFFWQDSQGKEIDCLLPFDDGPRAVEIKSGKTLTESYFSNLKIWQQLAGAQAGESFVIYGGERSMTLEHGTLLGWQDVDRVWA